MRNSFVFGLEVENAKKTTAPGLVSWVTMYDSGRVEVDHNKTVEQTKSARRLGRMTNIVPSRVAALVFVFGEDQSLEIIKGGEYVESTGN
jgi:hypothetical protein